MELSVLSGKNILVVEDNSINQMLVRYTLSKTGAQIEIADNGSIALQKIKENTYDVILMDIHMPELDGYQTTQIIRNELLLNTPIIAMTALAIKGEEEKCIGLGMSGYVSKPFTTESLCSELIRVLQTPRVALNETLRLQDGQINIDLTFLQELAGDDLSYVKTMLNMFLENMPATIQKIKDAAQEADWDKLFKAAHYAKSSLSVVKINVLYDLCVALEHEAKSEKSIAKSNDLATQIEVLYNKAAFLLQKDVIYVSNKQLVA